MYEAERFKDSKLAIDITDATDGQLDSLDYFFMTNKLAPPFRECLGYAKETRKEDWIYIFLDTMGLNAHKEGGRDYIYSNFDVVTAAEFLACIEAPPSFEILDDEFDNLF